MPSKRKTAIWRLNAPWDGARIAGADTAITVYVFDLKSRKRILAFDTPFDGGMSRLAINPRGDILTVGSYEDGGIACYAADTGELIGFRDDVNKVQRVTHSPDGKRLYCTAARGPMKVLDAETLADIAKVPSIDGVNCSPYQPIELLSTRFKGQLELRTLGGRRVATIPRESFAVSDVAFGPEAFCLTEADGPVRCFDASNGKELWRFTPQPRRSVHPLAYTLSGNFFCGLRSIREGGTEKELLRFDAASGKSVRVSKINSSCLEVFASRGETLITTDGDVIDICTLKNEKRFRFPSAQVKSKRSVPRSALRRPIGDPVLCSCEFSRCRPAPSL